MVVAGRVASLVAGLRGVAQRRSTMQVITAWHEPRNVHLLLRLKTGTTFDLELTGKINCPQLDTMASKGASSANPDAWPTLEEHNSSVSEVPVGRVSCLTCRRRKIKCDKLSPCSHCVRSHSHCDYAPRKRAPKRSKKNADNGREAELLSRLNKLEGRRSKPLAVPVKFMS